MPSGLRSLAEKLRSALVVGTILWLTCSGCGKKGMPLESKRAELVRLGTLPGLQQTTHPGLREEFARIRNEQATPLLLQELDRKIKSAPRQPNDPSAHRTPGQPSASLSGPVFDLTVEQTTLIDIPTIRSIQSALRKTYPVGKFQFDLAALWRATQLRQTHWEKCQRFREMVMRPEADFSVAHSSGLALNTSFVDAADALSRLEAFYIAECLHESRVDQGIDSLASIFRTVELLGNKHHLVARMAAARLRLDGLRIVEAITQHPNSNKVVVEKLQGLIAGQLESWPPDENAWRGDRAAGLHTFELIRQGNLLSFFDFDEVHRLMKSGELHALSAAISKGLDEDEYFYLSECRRNLECCRIPYWQRKATLDQIESNLAQLRLTTRRPYVADRFLMTHWRTGHRLQAIDRAATEAWNLALLVSLGNNPAAQVPSPLTGEPFQIEVHGPRIEVSNIGCDEIEQPLYIASRRHGG